MVLKMEWGWNWLWSVSSGRLVCISGVQSSDSAITRLDCTIQRTSQRVKPLSHSRTAGLWWREEPSGAIKAPSQEGVQFKWVFGYVQGTGNTLILRPAARRHFCCSFHTTAPFCDSYLSDLLKETEKSPAFKWAATRNSWLPNNYISLNLREEKSDQRINFGHQTMAYSKPTL